MSFDYNIVTKTCTKCDIVVQLCLIKLCYKILIIILWKVYSEQSVINNAIILCDSLRLCRLNHMVYMECGISVKY